MKLKKILLGITGALAFAFALTACGDEKTDSGSTTPATNDSGSGSTDSGQTDTSALSFMGNNKIRVDILDDLGVNFNYGNEAVVSKKEITIVNDQTFAYSGDYTVDKVNYIAYMEKESGPSTIWHKGLDASYFFTEVLPRNNFNGIKKIYIAISTGEVKWTTGLNASLDANFNRYKNMAA